MKQRKRIATFAKILRTGLPTLFDTGFSEDLQAALNPHLKIERYGRAWRVSRATVFKGTYLTAKLGFERSTPSEEVYFDDEKEDFVTTLRPAEQGRFSHFVIDLSSGFFLFEERPPEIKRQSFLGAITKLLKESVYHFEVQVLFQPQAFLDWASTVERVVLFYGKFERPNPQWRPRTEEVRRLVESTNADLMEIEARKIEDSQDGLNVEESLLGQVVEHAEGGYGKLRAVGIRNGDKTTFRSEENAATAEVVETTDDDSQTIFQKLINVLKERLLGERDKE